MSDHIERRVIAPNVDPMRTHLNRELVRMPEGIRERDDAIAARISSAGIRRCNLQIFLCLFLEKLNMPQNTPVTKAS